MVREPAAASPILSDHRFSSFEAYEPHLPGFQGRIVIGGRGPFRARVRRLLSPRLRVLCAETEVSHVVHGPTVDRMNFVLPDGGLYAFNGREVGTGTMLQVSGQRDKVVRCTGPMRLWTFSLDREEFRRATAVLLHDPGRMLRDPLLHLRLDPIRERRIRAIMAHAVTVRDPHPTLLADALLQHALAALMENDGMEAAPRGVGPARRRSIANGLVEMAELPGEQPSLVQICAVLGVPLRTLNLCANAVLGMSAAAYLRRRRLHAAFSTIRSGLADSVTEAATRHGFWELGRFAGAYRELFGETPSATLRRTGPVRRDA